MHSSRMGTCSCLVRVTGCSAGGKFFVYLFGLRTKCTIIILICVLKVFSFVLDHKGGWERWTICINSSASGEEERGG